MYDMDWLRTRPQDNVLQQGGVAARPSVHSFQSLVGAHIHVHTHTQGTDRRPHHLHHHHRRRRCRRRCQKRSGLNSATASNTSSAVFSSAHHHPVGTPGLPSSLITLFYIQWTSDFIVSFPIKASIFLATRPLQPFPLVGPAGRNRDLLLLPFMYAYMLSLIFFVVAVAGALSPVC